MRSIFNQIEHLVEVHQITDVIFDGCFARPLPKKPRLCVGFEYEFCFTS